MWRYRKPSLRSAALFSALAFSALTVISLYRIISWLDDKSAIQQIEEELSAVVVEQTDVQNPSEPSADPVDSTTAELINPPAKESSNDYWDFIKLPMISVDFANLTEKNSDTVGWLRLPATNINYPVVQSADNSYYLNRAFNRARNSAGWIFLDAENSRYFTDKNTIIYGHNRSDGTMFGTLKNVLTENWLGDKANHVVYLSTPSSNTMWQIFSAYVTAPEGYYLTTAFSNDSEFSAFLEAISGRSNYNFGSPPTVADNILTLSTCANRSSDRLVVHARLIKRESR